MPSFTRRALGAALTAAAGAAPLAAQQAASPAPQVTAGALIYTQYVYQLKDSVNHLNNFDITRAYLNVLGRFAGGVTTRLTFDVQRFGAIPGTTPQATDNSLRLRLKYAFATYTPQGSPLT